MAAAAASTSFGHCLPAYHKQPPPWRTFVRRWLDASLLAATFSRCHRRNWTKRSAFHSARALSMNARRATFRRDWRRRCRGRWVFRWMNCWARRRRKNAFELGRQVECAASLKRPPNSHDRSRRRSRRSWKSSLISTKHNPETDMMTARRCSSPTRMATMAHDRAAL